MKGHAILGVITGFLFGLFLGITLFLFGAIPLTSEWLWILPLLGILLGLIMAAWAPFGKSAAPVPEPPVPNATPAAIPPATDAPVPPADTDRYDPTDKDEDDSTTS